MVRTNHPDVNYAIDRSLESLAVIDQSAEDDYFENTKAPDYLPELEKEVVDFIKIQEKRSRKIAVITSGGTTVPLENNTVRFIDNFSAGTRGSVSAEYFLNNGYAVIFLHREFSLKPFSQHYSNMSIMDLLEVNQKSGDIEVKSQYRDLIKRDLEAYNQVKADEQLLEVPFTTVNQYLYTLRMISCKLKPFQKQALFYLAAAVSDFFLPMSKISEHKIQSRGMAKLVVDLDPVPKFLNTLTKLWTPGAMIISFKLETDEKILMSKCHDALKKYGHQLVIGNLLQTRKNEVYLVSPTTEQRVALDDSAEAVKQQPANIEAKFLPIVLEMHQNYIAQN